MMSSTRPTIGATNPQFSQDQLLEMTRLAADATRAADPKAVRVVNNCCLFAEYVAEGGTYRGKQPRPLRTPLQDLRAVLKAGVDLDAIGLQVYYPEHDLFEIARMLDRFAALGKPLHVAELGVSSIAARDEQSMGKEPTKSYWHAPWSEEPDSIPSPYSGLVIRTDSNLVLIDTGAGDRRPTLAS